MSTPLLHSDQIPNPHPHETRALCLSSDAGSEANDAFPNALALDVPATPDERSPPEMAPARAVHLIRRRTLNPKPGGADALGMEASASSDSAAVAALAAPATTAAGVVERRKASRPASSRPSKYRLSIVRKLSIVLGFGGDRAEAEKRDPDFQPHESILKVLDYRPRGHGRPFSDSYTLGELLGTGGFGVVREGTSKADGEVFAVKVIAREAIADVDALTHEVEILRRLDHHQVTRFIDFYEEPVTYYLVLEKVPGGELFDRIISEGPFEEKDAKACVQSLLEALAYCHSQQIAHRDIKPENILFASLEAKDRTLKLADFGLARSVAAGLLTGKPCGTPTYMAPERLKLLPHGIQVDCWAVGVVTHILLGGYAPFASSRMQKLFRLIKKGHVAFDDVCWGSISQRAKDFILALLEVDPDVRLNSKQALRHPWLTGADEETGEDQHMLERSLANLRVLNAKQKFRVAVHSLIACQQLNNYAAGSKGGDQGNGAPRPLAASAPRAPDASATKQIRSSFDSGDQPSSPRNQRWTFSPSSVTPRPTKFRAASPRPTEIERRRFFSRDPSPRKSTGIFVEQDWRKKVLDARLSRAVPKQGRGLQVKKSAVMAAAQREVEEVVEDEESSSSEDEDNKSTATGDQVDEGSSLLAKEIRKDERGPTSGQN